jgi:hypothetical protein
MLIPLTLSLASGQLVTSMESDVPITTLQAKRGGGSEILLRLYESVFPGDADTLQIRLVAKQQGKFDGPIAAEATAWTFDGTRQGYTSSISFLTEIIDDLFEVDGNPENDRPTVDLMLELAWREDAEAPWLRSQTVRLTLQNNVFRGDELSPAPSPLPSEYGVFSASQLPDKIRVTVGSETYHLPATLVLPTPTGLVVTPGDGELDITWTQVMGAEYTVYWNAGGDSFASAQQLSAGLTSGATLTDLTNGMEVTVWLQAGIGSAVSEPSAPVSATPSA